MSLQYCDVAHGFYCEGRVYTRCYACGMPACRECSTHVQYRGRERRLCLTCLEQHDFPLEAEVVGKGDHVRR